MKIKLTPTILDELSCAIEDAQQPGSTDPADVTYRKIAAAAEAGGGYYKPVLVDLDDADVGELKSRAEYNVGPHGVCAENLAYCHREDRGYWLGRLNAYRALLRQIAATQITTRGQGQRR